MNYKEELKLKVPTLEKQNEIVQRLKVYEDRVNEAGNLLDKEKKEIKEALTKEL